MLLLPGELSPPNHDTGRILRFDALLDAVSSRHLSSAEPRVNQIARGIGCIVSIKLHAIFLVLLIAREHRESFDQIFAGVANLPLAGLQKFVKPHPSAYTIVVGL